MSTKIILFVSRHVPTTEQINITADLGFAIRHVGDFNAFAPTGEFEKFLNEKRLEATRWDDTGVFGLEQRDVVVCVAHPALALRASLVGHTVVVFENAARPAEGAVNTPSFSSLHFYDPQFDGFFISIPYTPPEIPERQILTDEDRLELNGKKVEIIIESKEIESEDEEENDDDEETDEEVQEKVSIATRNW